MPFGWIIGCPLLGALSDRLRRRKPVIIGSALVLLLCFVLMLYGPAGVFPPFFLGLVAGIASGAAMIPYTVIKEANRPEHKGTATWAQAAALARGAAGDDPDGHRAEFLGLVERAQRLSGPRIAGAAR